jgi:two-component system chemotaxis sensor kinase CheA
MTNESVMPDNELLREFLLETHENLTLLDSDLITLEKNPTEKNTLAQVFRTLHSVKGTAGFMGLVKLQAVAHAAESLLSKLRGGELRFNPPIATALLRVVDAIREMLSFIEKTGDEGLRDYTVLIADVDRLRENGSGSISVTPPPAPAPVVQPFISAASSVSSALSDVTRMAPAISSSSLSSTSDPGLPPLPENSSEARSANVADSNIRVDVSLLDKLMTLVGELVLARNQILQYNEVNSDDSFAGAVQRLNLLTTELQASVMKTRMQPIGNVLNKFPRVVRDLALACGKKVHFEVDGQDTELDKTLIEAIRDPLTHMVRNAIDHGIELPETRIQRGKPEEGRLRMVARHEGGKVIIELSDDGGGIDVGRVREKVLSGNLVSPDLVARMSAQEIMRLIFLPGFSTAENVTQFSGRGVGMDVVRTNIEKIGGTVDIESQPGQGTTIRTRIPLTLAIIPALIIVSGEQRYAIPQVSLLELLRVSPGQSGHGIEMIHDVPVFRLRGMLLPLVFLNEQLRTAASTESTDVYNIIVLQADDRSFGLVVDAIGDTEEIVVKPLQKQLKNISLFAGAAIMGDGRVALVLDIPGLAECARVISATRNRELVDEETSTKTDVGIGQSLLLFATAARGQMAIPLPLVARLEEIRGCDVEMLGSRSVIQYRDEILLLIDVVQELELLIRGPQAPGVAPEVCDRSAGIPVIVCVRENQKIGLIVDRILDIVHWNDDPTARGRSSRPGVMFTAIVQGRVTEFLDIAALVQNAAGTQIGTTNDLQVIL